MRSMQDVACPETASRKCHKLYVTTLLTLVLLGFGAAITSAAPATASRTLPCVALGAGSTSPGCPCTVTIGTDPAPLYTPCAAGYRCSTTLLALLTNTSSEYAGVPEQVPGQKIGVCSPCSLGEYCPVGTVEETDDSISLCRTSPFHFAKLRNISDFQGTPAQLAALCRGYKACPRGTFCPNPATSIPCQLGAYCSEGNSALVTCNISRTFQWQPYAVVQSEPQFLMAALVASRQPADGNTCPANSSTPTQPCPAGWICPTESNRTICPRGSYCPAGSMRPLSCPWLSSCNGEGNASPRYAWPGLLLILGLLGLLSLALELLRRRGQALQRRRVAEGDVQQLLGTLGFQLVATEGKMGVCQLQCRHGKQQQPGASGSTWQRWRDALLHGHATASLDATAASRLGNWVETGSYHHSAVGQTGQTGITKWHSPEEGAAAGFDRREGYAGHGDLGGSGGGGDQQRAGARNSTETPGVTPAVDGVSSGDTLVCQKVCVDTPAGRLCTLECVIQPGAEGEAHTAANAPAAPPPAAAVAASTTTAVATDTTLLASSSTTTTSSSSSSNVTTGGTRSGAGVTRYGPNHLGEAVDHPGPEAVQPGSTVNHHPGHEAVHPCSTVNGHLELDLESVLHSGLSQLSAGASADKQLLPGKSSPQQLHMTQTNCRVQQQQPSPQPSAAALLSDPKLVPAQPPPAPAASSSQAGPGPIYPRLSLVFKELTLLRGRCGTRLVSDITGRFVHSKMHAIMGPSGCGKTSLCVGLAGKVLPSRLRGELSVVKVDQAPTPTTDTAITIPPPPAHNGSSGALPQAAATKASGRGVKPGNKPAAGCQGSAEGTGGGVGQKQGTLLHSRLTRNSGGGFSRSSGGAQGETSAKAAPDWTPAAAAGGGGAAAVGSARDWGSNNDASAGASIGMSPTSTTTTTKAAMQPDAGVTDSSNAGVTTSKGALHPDTGVSDSASSSKAAYLKREAMQALLKLKYTVGRNKEVLLLDDDPAAGVAVRMEDVRFLTGFVPQDDLLHGSLTVGENLCYAAKLLMPPGTTTAGYVAAVREVLSLMGLAGVAQQQVGSAEKRGISGGQRKRLNIGVELVHTPSLLFLDEPTSGLDAAVAYDVMTALSNYSSRGMNVVCVIHQPRQSIFEMFDSVTLLSKGHTVYHGPQFLTVPYLNFLGFPMPAGETTADFLLDVVAGAVPRPRDPEFVPSELPQVWARCGDTWVEQQLEALLEAPTMCVRQLLGQAITLCPGKLQQLLGACTTHHQQQLADSSLEQLQDALQQHPQYNDPQYMPRQAALGPGGKVTPAVRLLMKVCSSAKFSPHTKWEQQQAEVEAQLEVAAIEVDWPWRPRQLEALQQRFKLMVEPADTTTHHAAAAGSWWWGGVRRCRGAASAGAGGGVGGTGAVLTYEGFLDFWSGLKTLMPPDEYSRFIDAICQDFGIRPGVSVTKRHFMSVLQHHMRAAAAWSSTGPAATAAGSPATARRAAGYYGPGFTGTLAGSATAEAAAALTKQAGATAHGQSGPWQPAATVPLAATPAAGDGSSAWQGGTAGLLPAGGSIDVPPQASKVCGGRSCPDTHLADIAAQTLGQLATGAAPATPTCTPSQRPGNAPAHTPSQRPGNAPAHYSSQQQGNGPTPQQSPGGPASPAVGGGAADSPSPTAGREPRAAQLQVTASVASRPPAAAAPASPQPTHPYWGATPAGAPAAHPHPAATPAGPQPAQLHQDASPHQPETQPLLLQGAGPPAPQQPPLGQLDGQPMPVQLEPMLHQQHWHSLELLQQHHHHHQQQGDKEHQQQQWDSAEQQQLQAGSPQLQHPSQPATAEGVAATPGNAAPSPTAAAAQGSQYGVLPGARPVGTNVGTAAHGHPVTGAPSIWTAAIPAPTPPPAPSTPTGQGTPTATMAAAGGSSPGPATAAPPSTPTAAASPTGQGGTAPSTPLAGSVDEAAISLYEGIDALSPSESSDPGAIKCTKPNISCALHFIREEAEDQLQERVSEVLISHQQQQPVRSSRLGGRSARSNSHPGSSLTGSYSRRSIGAASSTASGEDAESDHVGGSLAGGKQLGHSSSSISSSRHSGSNRTGRSTTIAKVKVKRPTLLTDLEAFVPEQWEQRRLRAQGSQGPPGGRLLPGTLHQMWTIFLRSGRKWMNAREVVLADVLLTALLGCILSVAQQQAGGSPEEALLWMVITIMAFGCLTLMRAVRSFGGERVIFLQRESRAGLQLLPYLLGRFTWDLITMTLQTGIFLGFLYSPVPPIPSSYYFAILLVTAWYTTGLGYLVSMAFSAQNGLLAGIAVGLLLGGVANGVQPPQHTMPPWNPLWILDWVSFTRYAVEALYISWLVPTTTALAPRTATFMAGTGFCGLQNVLQPAGLLSMNAGQGTAATLAELFDSTSATNSTGSNVLTLTSQQRTAGAAQSVLQRNAAGANDPAVAAAAQLFLFYSEPHRLQDMCWPHLVTDVLVVLLLGAVCRLLLAVIIKVKVLWKAQS